MRLRMRLRVRYATYITNLVTAKVAVAVIFFCAIRIRTRLWLIIFFVGASGVAAGECLIFVSGG